MQFRYVEGDATRPLRGGVALILHAVNDRGGWGKGFTGALSQRWREPEEDYRIWYRQVGCFLAPEQRLGTVIRTHVEHSPLEHELFVLGIVAQRGYSTGSRPAARLDALGWGCTHISGLISEGRLPAGEVSLHMPRILCGLGGSRWSEVLPVLEQSFSGHDLWCNVYDLVPYQEDEP